jgi:mRNA-binding protein PUF3
VLVKQRSALISELEPDVLKVMKDQHGNHVIQKALEAGLPEDLGFIFRSFRGRVKELACHTCACRVLQKAMDRSPTAKASIIEEMLPQARELTNDQYGNYVIQHVLKIGRPEDRTRIINSILGSVVHFSKQKYASNVIEKCALYGTPEEVLKIEAEMTATGPDSNTFLHSMIVDQYANYVVRK